MLLTECCSSCAWWCFQKQVVVGTLVGLGSVVQEWHIFSRIKNPADVGNQHTVLLCCQGTFQFAFLNTANKTREIQQAQTIWSVFVYRKEHNNIRGFLPAWLKDNYFSKKWLSQYIPRTLTLRQLITLFSEQEMKRVRGWETIYVCTGFERFGLAEQYWNLMLSLTFKALKRSMLGMDTTTRLEGRLLI